MIHTGNALEAAIEERAAGFIASRIGHNLPPWALTLFSLGDDRRVLTLSIHHSYVPPALQSIDIDRMWTGT